MHPDIERLFEQEAKILYKLGQNHKQIPKLFASFQENGEFYLIQEFIDGHDLGQEITRGKRWNEAEVIKFLRELLEVLAYVHQNNLIHRDIKPLNIMRRRENDKLVLIDFGIVKEISTLVVNASGQTNLTVAIGTLGYMPSEQAQGKPKLSSDIYAVGITAIQFLTGIPPHQLPEDINGEVIWRNHASVSDWLADILTKMVRYHFNQRYQSAAEVLQALTPTQKLSPTPTPKPSPTPTPKPSPTPTPIPPPPPPPPLDIPWVLLAQILLLYIFQGCLVGLSTPMLSPASVWAWIWASALASASALVWAWTWASALFRVGNGEAVITAGFLVGPCVFLLAGLGWILGAWTLFWALIFALFSSSAWASASEELLKSFSRFHTFLILAGASLLGLGSGELVLLYLFTHF